MFVKLLFVIFSAIVLTVVENARILARVKRESLKVRITAKDDSIVFQYLAPHPAIKLRGYILGYGGRYSKQNISLPDNGEPIELDVEFTPKYLIAVHPVAEYSSASAVKKCKGSVELHRPLQVMINALTSTSVLLTWGQNYEEECNADVDSECTDERHFTVRYREKEKNKKWLYQFCPTTKTVVDKLKPNTVYEFGVRVTKPKEDSIWGRATAHTTSATTSPSNTRTEQVKINKFNPYFKKDRNNGDMAKLKPSGKVNHIGPKHRKPDVITSAPGADLLVFDTLKSNRNPPSKEHRPMQSNPLPENDVVNKVEKKGIDSKPTSRNDKKEIAKQKAPATPSKANESKRPSSVNSSLPSNPGLEPHATGKPQFIEFQVPSSNHSNLFTSERASDLETKDKQQSTESEIPSSTKMPFTILSTTSKHTAEDKQKLPEIKAPSSTNSFLITSNPAHASNPVDIKQLKEPEVPYPNSSPFHPTSEPDAKDVEKLTEPEVPFSSISSFNPTTEPGTLGMQKFTDLETPLSSTSFFSNSKMTSTLDVTDGQKSTEKVTEGPPSNGNFYSIPSSTSELDTMDEQQFSEYVVPHSISSNVNTLSTPSEPDNVDKQEFTEHEVTSSNSSFFTTSTASSELHPPERQPNSEHKLSTADTPYVISGTRAYEYNIEDHKFTDHKPPTFDTPHVFSGIPVTELTNIEDNKPTGHKLPTVDTPHVFSGSSASELDKLEDNKSTDIQIKQNAVREQHFASLQPKDHKLTTADTPLMFSGAPVSELDNIQDHKLTDNKASTTDSTYVLSGISAKEFDNIGDRKPIGRKLPTADTPHVFSGSSASGLDKLEDNKSTDHKPPTANTPQVFSGIAVSELDNLEGNKSTDLERLTSDTIQVFRPSHVSQLGSTGGKKRTGTDPMADPLSKPKSDAKWNILEPSADVQSSTSSNPLSEKDATGLATETTNLNMFTEHNEVENTTVLSSTPISEIDSLGKERYTGPHVKYFGKDPNVPCSINEALKYFVNKNHTNVKVTTAPRYPPTNVTILTVEGCSTFVIVVWEKNDNDSATEFELVSTALGPDNETEKIVTVTNQTHITVENLSPNTSYVFLVKPKNRLGVGPPSEPVPFVTESADPRVSEYVPGKAAIWSPYRFKFDSFSECQGKQYVKRTWYRKFVGIILCNSLRYKIYLSDKLSGVFYNIGDLSGHGEDHCQFVDSFLDGRTGHHLLSAQLPVRPGFYRSLRQEPVMFGTIGGHTHISYVHWYECGIAIPGKW
ncbi:target of Nesh-SH3 [Callorhinchus milii]|uniref:target of Nesh-SH3 n=1 Tax=Callorhinchus milii TaxID=7868 RepID=UPI001C3FD36B|nr:target of Nesh-SH3 [Callorhinchus milii]